MFFSRALFTAEDVNEQPEGNAADTPGAARKELHFRD
jgi:hypothetical protein